MTDAPINPLRLREVAFNIPDEFTTTQYFTKVNVVPFLLTDEKGHSIFNVAITITNDFKGPFHIDAYISWLYDAPKKHLSASHLYCCAEHCFNHLMEIIAVMYKHQPDYPKAQLPTYEEC